jgi:GNAT superfamily N-acetyltransferase
MHVRTGKLAIESLDAVRHAHRIVEECVAFDQPDVPPTSLATFRSSLDAVVPHRRVERYLGYLGHTPVGYLVLRLPQADNLAVVELDLLVLPAYRRHGVGRALMELAVGRARELGRGNLIAATVQTRPDGGCFAAAVGATPGRQGIRLRLTLPATDQERLDEMLTEAWKHAPGYRVIRWTGVPPAEVIDDVAYLQSRLNLDEPSAGDLGLEPERVDAEAIRATELARIKRGRTTYHVGALAGDRLVAWTAAAGRDEQPSQVWQLTTLVDPGHRGHRLGLIVKLENLRYLRAERPALAEVDTINASSNDYMLAVNRAMGFAPVETMIQWRLDL